MKQLVLDIAARPQPTLESFLPGRNAELVATLVRIARGQPGERFAFLWGQSGSGRTHLLRAVAGSAGERGASAHYLGPGASADEIARIGDSDVACIDDVDQLDAAAEHALFVLCNRMREARGAMIAAGPIAPAGLDLRADVGTRLGWGLVYEVHALTDEEKSAAMRAHARSLGFELAAEVCGYVLRHGRRDLPALLSVVASLDRASLERHRPVTVALAREVLRPRSDALAHGEGAP